MTKIASIGATAANNSFRTSKKHQFALAVSLQSSRKWIRPIKTVLPRNFRFIKLPTHLPIL